MTNFPKEAVVAELKKHPQILLAFLFGSAAQGRSRKGSDVDIALLLKSLPGAEGRLALKTALAERLSRLFHQEPDIFLLNAAGSIAKYQVARDGLLLFERRKGQAKAFRLAAIKEYFDYLPTFQFHTERHKRSA